ncbi:XdhC family protein [Streptomyces sp. PSKA01]|uniref:XdhC family protein n=1 Tax=Streptomyces cupreus TaxID=2759956 RepID=A0A7X1JBJ5_9ACTN|nr:XdhC family protein [Streptomyces cupreus]
MRDLLPMLSAWYTAGSPFGLATVVATSRSAPREPGATMAVEPDKTVLGVARGANRA